MKVLNLYAVVAVGVLSVLVFPGWTDEQAGVLVWLTALVPAFLLTYYRGWQGASLALAVGMVVDNAIVVLDILEGQFSHTHSPLLYHQRQFHALGEL